ncbi:MAG: DUF4388 domain-containing protein [Candidatus Desulfofervidaceae bacterium]|nr:DUF4388 domain-containing protein [Candidatus Desulfofervidaceae bacterium]
MMKMLEGNLKQIGVIELLDLLVKAKHSGRLTLITETGKGYIFIENGQIYAAQWKEKVGYDALFNLAKIDEGSFAFEDKISIPEKHFHEESMEILRKINEDLDISESVNSEQNKVLSLIPVEKQVTLAPKEWMVVALSQKSLTLFEIAKRLKLELVEVIKIAKDLEKRELVELKVRETGKDIEKLTPPLFWKALKTKLATLMGPIAEAIIEDIVAEMEETKERFPYSKLPVLVDRLSQEIENNERRIAFQKEMLEILKRL